MTVRIKTIDPVPKRRTSGHTARRFDAVPLEAERSGGPATPRRRARSSDGSEPEASPDLVSADFDHVNRHLETALTGFAEARRVHGLGGEEILIFLAVGHLGLEPRGPVQRLVPRTNGEIAALTGIPRETVRRKIARLCDCGVTEMTPHGVVVRDIAAWSSFARMMAPPAEHET